MLLAECRLDEHGVVAVLFQPDRPKRNRLGHAPHLAPQHDARQIAEWIKIEQERRGAVECGRRISDLGRGPDRPESPQPASGPSQHLVPG
ncbi:MAG TPA: hypothetical protein VLB11_00865 [Methyloceanibacter sp.]|nr:hypothetical protein [Methyloceanibacter sp.]